MSLVPCMVVLCTMHGQSVMAKLGGALTGVGGSSIRRGLSDERMNCMFQFHT